MKGDKHHFKILGVPISKKRPRFVSSKGKNGKDFTRNVNIQQTEEGRFLWDVLTQLDNKDVLTGAIRIDFGFFFERPKSHFGTGRNANKLKDSAPTFCNKVAKDCDNMEKFAMDSMNKYIYLDDRQVVELSSRKCWCLVEPARTLFTITELE